MEYEEDMRPEKQTTPNYLAEWNGYIEPYVQDNDSDIDEVESNIPNSTFDINEIENKKCNTIIIIY